MKKRSMAAGLAMLALLGVSQARAAAPVGVQIEVNFLLGYVEGSRCEFQRNGTWHDSAAAQEHLRDKFNYLSARDLIQTTEQFIDRGASNSSLSGQPYLVRCDAGPTITSNRWLHDELARFRTRP